MVQASRCQQHGIGGGHSDTDATLATMTNETLRYEKMVEQALRGVVRDAVLHVAEHGLTGSHHFYITFKTAAPGVDIPDSLSARYPAELTVVLEHQFWDLSVTDGAFSVTLSFQNRPERLTIPFAAITAFTDPSAKFGLQFQENAATAAVEGPAEGREKAAPKLVEVKPVG